MTPRAQRGVALCWGHLLEDTKIFQGLEWLCTLRSLLGNGGILMRCPKVTREVHPVATRRVHACWLRANRDRNHVCVLRLPREPQSTEHRGRHASPTRDTPPELPVIPSTERSMMAGAFAGAGERLCVRGCDVARAIPLPPRGTVCRGANTVATTVEDASPIVRAGTLETLLGP